jgi:hypothetical protein
MPMHTNASDPQPVSEDTVKTLIEKLERDELSGEDRKLIAKVLNSYLFAARLLKESGVKIKNLRDFFLGSTKINP